MKKQYRVLIGIEYGGKAVPPGEEVDDVPRRSVPWLLEQQAIEEIVEEQSPPPESQAGDGEVGR